MVAGSSTRREVMSATEIGVRGTACFPLGSRAREWDGPSRSRGRNVGAGHQTAAATRVPGQDIDHRLTCNFVETHMGLGMVIMDVRAAE